MICNGATRYDRDYSLCVRNRWKGKNNILRDSDINTLTYYTMLLSCTQTNANECTLQTDVYTLGSRDSEFVHKFSAADMCEVALYCHDTSTEPVLLAVLLTSGLLLLTLFVPVLWKLIQRLTLVKFV